ncbi:MAG: efflux RND transporter periplasmic adaptor subunit [Bacteroidota bacterium]|jgi:RND family efflux transporter MFP subunit|nr:efflux RND transporter periplasmic adaptor subunit [Prolixibacteraceae bacterium]MDI9563778.1 efflux RND transporter periplasmic adaptor subunit [Bacteroidota bacterium]OQB81605.1 MAG: Multidrug export protein AcrE precursor [Bacteroidetes bacterium ADurb.Bin123]HNZ68782.1 efflux RND transporter periplasmic adaptor subunit [Prolixibacteraceae bacterium]HOC86377.1 efflux RND transporter periplasmic adaptor subunit [Prolixibacteraceae bacterium]
MIRKSVLLSAMVLIILSACSGGKEKTTGMEKAASGPSKTEIVKVMQLEMQKISHAVEYTATLQGYEEVHLAPAAPGRIEAIYVEEGSRVLRGQVLVQMDRTQLHQAEIQMRTLATDFARLDTLQKVGSIPQQQYDQLKAQYEIARSNVEFLTGNTRLKAPFSGIISGKYFEAGEMYSGAPVAPVGKAAILSLVQIDRLKVIVPVSEKYYPQIQTGMNAKISVDIYPGQEFSGKVVRIFPTIDPASHTFSVEVVTPNSSAVLRPGMFARVSFDLGEVDAVVLPALAVLKMQGSNERYLFVEKDGKAERIPVSIGARFDDRIEVISDLLKPGDRVIVSGQSRLLHGVPVQVVP